MARGHAGPRPRRPSTSSRTACSRSASRRATSFAMLARTSLEWALFDFALALVGAVGAPIYAIELARATCSTCSSTRTRVGVLVEDEEQRAKVADAACARDLVRRARRAARARPRVRRRAPGRARRARRLDRRGRPLHVHLHVGHDRTAEGLHDPPPQLLRDGAEGRRDGGPPDRAGRRDAALPAARPQLRAPAPPVGRLHRLHDRVPARPAARRRRAAARAADALPERAARLREDPRGRRRASSPSRPGAQKRIVDWALARRPARVPTLRQAKQPVPRDARRCSTASPTGSSTRR